MAFRLATVLWGNWYLERFLVVTIPSLLADGNVPAILRRGAGVYDITTRASEARALKRSPAFAALES